MKYDFKPYDRVLTRDGENQCWQADIFSHCIGDDGDIYICISGTWSQCIPFEGNERLVGTSDNPIPPEPDFNLGDKVEVRISDGQKWIKAIFTGYDPRYEKKKLYLAVSVYDVTIVDCWEQCRHADW